MAYSSVPSVVTGQTYPASSYNTYVKANFDALWVFTTAGDIAYASTPTTRARLGIGQPGEVLTVNPAGNAPIWKRSNSLAMAIVFGG
jgi:hypothetical protein